MPPKFVKDMTEEEGEKNMPDEKWLIVHEDLSSDGSILRWQWCGLFKTREGALKLLKKNIIRIIGEYVDTVPSIEVKTNNTDPHSEITITIEEQRFKLCMLIEEAYE